MEGLVLSACTAFMSFASILWLVVVKLATGNESDKDDSEANNIVTDAISTLPSSSPAASSIGQASANLSSSSPPPSSAVTLTSKSNVEEKKQLSRRQRRNINKNKKREKDVDVFFTSGGASSSSSSCSSSGSLLQVKSSGKKRSALASSSRFYLSLPEGLSDDQIYYHLLNYILDQNTLRNLGFPLESQLSPGKAWVFQDPEYRGGANNFVFDDNEVSKLDVNAREFVPLVSKALLLEDASESNSGDEVASTHSSSNSLSASAKEFIPAKTQSLEEEAQVEPRNCARCNKLYYVFKSTGQVLHPEDCIYHWGKARSSRKYSCCGKRSKNPGCEKAPSHVWRGILYEISGQHKDLDGFAKTRVPRNRAQPTDGNYGVYGIDGEMLFTTGGLQLCKITVVGIDGRLVYESLLQPDDEIIDYNTRFSGVSAKDLKRGPVKSLKDVQNDLLGFINANTILIGHGLENDLRALKLVHMTVIDTSLVFPHYYGMPFRRSLKSIVQSYLGAEIQGEKCGHDSYEDARSCLDLMLWKVQQDLNSSVTDEAKALSSSTYSSKSSPPAKN